MDLRMWAEFNNAEHEVITGIFTSPQPVEWVAYMAEVFADDPRYKVWHDIQVAIGTYLDGLPDATYVEP